jgi:HSP20 family protein
MSLRNPTDWMWAHACDLMDQAERMQRQFFQLSSAGQMKAVWEPPVDILEDDHEVVIVMALPGVAPERVQVTDEGGTLVVRAERRMPYAGVGRAVRRLEIPYGYFERRIALSERGLEAQSKEFMDGCLILRLRKTGHL